MREKVKSNYWTIAILTVYALILTMQNVQNPISQNMIYSDGAIYQYIGHLVLEGKMPYIDAFDHKGILLYLINALGYALSPRYGLWIIDSLCMIAILMFSYKTARFFLGKVMSVVVCVFIYSDFSDGYWIGDTPDFYATLFTAIAIYFLMQYYQKGKLSRKAVVIIAICFWGTFWLKQTLCMVILIMCGLIFGAMLVQKEWKAAFKCVLQFGITFAVPSFVICLWLHSCHAFLAMVKDYFLFNFSYTSDYVDGLSRMKEFFYLSKFSCVIIVWILFAVYCCLRIHNVQKMNSSKLIFHGMICMICSLIILSFSGRNFAHYLLFVYPLLVTIAAVLIKEIMMAEFENKQLCAIIGVVAVGATLIIPNLAKIEDYCVSYWTAGGEEAQVLADIQQVCSDGDTIAVATPDDCGYYLASGYESATTYPYIQDYLYGNEGVKWDYCNQIAENQPKVIVWHSNRSEQDFFVNGILDDYYLHDEAGALRVYVLIEPRSAEELAGICNFNEYFGALSKLEKCTTIISIKDIPGFGLNSREAYNMNRLGMRYTEQLLERTYHSYIGFFCNGDTVEEHLGGDECIEYSYKLSSGDSVKAVSATYNFGNVSSVLYKDKECSVNFRGINIVVIDNETGNVVDAVAFDTHVNELLCYR